MVLLGLKQVFGDIKYILLAAIVALATFTVAILLPNTKLVFQVVPDATIALGAKLRLLFSLFGSIQTNFTVVSAAYTIAIAVLFGINIALFAYYIRSRRSATAAGGTNAAAGIGGVVSGMFGIGCAACGTFILTWVLGFIGAAGLISFLPLGGEEFGILGVLLLSFSVYMVAQKVQEAFVCKT